VTSPTYGVFVDWDGDGGLSIGDFEQSVEGWDPAATGAALPTLARSTTRAYHGSTSLLVTWTAGGSLQVAQPDPMATFVIGTSYTLSAWVWVPSSGGMHVKCAVSGISSGTASSTTNAWVNITYTFTATATSHQLRIQANSTPSGGEQTWIDHVRLIGPGEDLLAAPPGVIGDVSIQYGRDQARGLQPVAPGECDFEVDNVSRALSPENSSSPLVGLLGPGREVLIEASYSGKAYTLFDGAVDDFDVDSTAGKWRAKFTAIDGLARLKNLPVSTALYPALRTGEAINKVLDAIGFTGTRDIDAGATTLRWWWADDDDAYQVLTDITAAEGPSAFVHIGSLGEFVFRDRHHRLLRTASAAVQATFKNSPAVAPDVEHDPPFKVNFGWRDVINQVEVSVGNRAPKSALEEIWSDDTLYAMAGGQRRTFTISTDEPFWALQPPTQGAPSTIGLSDPDFVVVGGTVTVTLSRTSGQSVTMTVIAGAALTVVSMRLRAYKLAGSSNSQKVLKQDTASITKTRGVKSYQLPGPPLNVEDAGAIADLILGKRADRLPTVTFTVTNGTATQVTQQLSRDLSDRIHVVDSESGVSADFFIERIEHTIGDEGNTHETRFSCEKIPAIPGNLFRFDTSGAGFNDGVFGPSGQDDPATMFIFDTAGHGFDQGLFCT